jgi:hypothetical protein
MEMVLTDIARQKGQVKLAPIVTPEPVKRLVGMKFMVTMSRTWRKGYNPLR